MSPAPQKAAPQNPAPQNAAPAGAAPTSSAHVGPAARPRPDWLGLLSDEERVPHDDASAIRRARAMLDRPDDEPDPVFVAANLLALVLFRQGRLDAARELCRAELAHARTCPPGARRARAAALALQPQVNLLRIEGYAGSLDRCLEGLVALEQVARGHGVHTAELHWAPEDLDGDPTLARRVRLLARNIRVADTCKILLRRGRTDELLKEAARLGALWPGLVRAGLQHAAEAPWAARPGAQRPPTPEELQAGTVQERRLALVRGLHCAAQAAIDGDGSEPELARRLDAALPAVAAEGRWASTLTVPRWRGVLGATLLLAGDRPRGSELMRESLAAADAAGDAALGRGLRQRLGAAPTDDRPAAPGNRAVPDDGQLEPALTAVLARLSGRSAGRPVHRPTPAGV